MNQKISQNRSSSARGMQLLFLIGLGISFATGQTLVEQWRQLHFGSLANSGPSSDLEDADKDGSPNIIEYSADTSPVRLQERPETGFRLQSNRSYFDFYRTPSRTDLIYTVQSSNNLTNWTDLASSTGGNPTTMLAAFSVTETAESGRLKVSVADALTASASPSSYFRMSVDRNPSSIGTKEPLFARQVPGETAEDWRRLAPAEDIPVT